MKDKPNVARASPYAGALLCELTQSAIYANVNGNVAEKRPDIPTHTDSIRMHEIYIFGGGRTYQHIPTYLR